MIFITVQKSGDLVRLVIEESGARIEAEFITEDAAKKMAEQLEGIAGKLRRNAASEGIGTVP